jgi:hypothetical protein
VGRALLFESAGISPTLVGTSSGVEQL